MHKRFYTMIVGVQWSKVVAWTVLALFVAAWFGYTWYADYAEWLEKSDHVSSIIVGISLVWASTRYLVLSRRTSEAERRASRYLAWQTISSAQGKPGNGGRADALRDLAHDGVSLTGVNLDGAYLEGLTLPPLTDLRNASFGRLNQVHAVLRSARLEQADLSEANLEGADLTEARLGRANLRKARLASASLVSAQMESAILTEAQLRDADLRYADLAQADLSGANLRGALLRHANLERVDFRNAVLIGADMKSARLHGANFRAAELQGANLEAITWDSDTTWIQGANIHGVRNAPMAFLAWAHENGAVESSPAAAGSGP